VASPQGILFAGASSFVQALAKAVQAEGYEVLLVDTNQRSIQQARMAGLPTVWASAVSEYVREEIDFGGIGRILAMTPNDEVNALAGKSFVEYFGRAGVYQLSTRPTDSERREQVSSEHRGRALFGSDVTYDRLDARMEAGAVIRKTALTEEFDYAAFREHYGPSAVVLCVIEESGKLSIVTVNEPVSPRSGQKLISLVDAEKNGSVEPPA
jgi:hypothetical protein